MVNEKLQALVAASRHTVAFTGAGVSTLSGIPDFRGKKGLYNNPENERIFDIDLFREDPGFFYSKCLSLLYGDQDISSSLIHTTLAQWEAEGSLKAIITQNIDLLHQKAGSKNVIEIHGSPQVHHCLTCNKSFTYAEITIRVHSEKKPPRCKCGGSIKPDITFFGENLPPEAWGKALDEAKKCDLMLILGTSLTVFPAANIPRMAQARGAKLIIINDQPTDLDALATLRLWDLEEAFSV